MVNNSKKRYERAEVTFSISDELDMKIYEYLLNQSIIVGKGNFLKQLIYNEMKKGQE